MLEFGYEYENIDLFGKFKKMGQEMLKIFQYLVDFFFNLAIFQWKITKFVKVKMLPGGFWGDNSFDHPIYIAVAATGNFPARGFLGD